MNFELSDEQRMVQETARAFASRVLAPRAAERDRTGSFPTEELRELGKLGLLGVNVPGELGGSEAGVVAYALAIEEIAHGCAATTVAVAVTNMVAELITRRGNEVSKRRWVPALTSGEAPCGAFALSEPQAGSDPGALATVARRTSKGWALTGTKQWISHGDHAGVIVVWAKTDLAAGTRGISAFLVARGTPGLSIGRHEDKLGLRGSTTVSLSLEDCEVDEEALLGREGEGMQLAMIALDGGRIGIASQALGLGRAALEAATAYSRDRKTFGARIADHQAVAFMLADSAVELSAARLMTWRAARLKEQGRPFTREASMAKVYASEAANRVCDRALQIHGGYGYTRDFVVERLFRDVRVTRIYEGTSEIQRLVIAREIFKQAEGSRR